MNLFPVQIVYLYSMTKEKQVHILIGCADARDLSQVQLNAVEAVTKEFIQRDIEIEYHVIRAAGSFVTPDVVMDIKRTIEQAERNLAGATKHSAKIDARLCLFGCPCGAACCRNTGRAIRVRKP